MNYEFPFIERLNDILPALDENHFNITEKNGYTVILYNAISPETFPEITDLNSKIRREFRGIIFDSNTKRIIRRPLHKFFNLCEKNETLLHNIDITKPHIILDKLDGSLISSFKLNDVILWGTKAGITDISKEAEVFVNKNKQYLEFAKYCAENYVTPMFEWISPNNRIVVPYSKDDLILLGIRDLYTGEYTKYSDLKDISDRYEIPLVNDVKNTVLNEQFIDKTINEKDIEGYIISFEDGHKIKIKTDEYVLAHRTIEGIIKQRNVARSIILNEVDDIKPLLHEDIRNVLEEYESEYINQLEKYVSSMCEELKYYKSLVNTRKEFAIKYSKDLPKFVENYIFCAWDEENPKITFSNFLVSYILKYSLVDISYTRMIEGNLPNLPKWNFKTRLYK
jgi:RNA ligase